MGSRRLKPEPMTRADRVIAFIHRYCVVPEGKLVGKPMRLRLFQRRFIRDIYDNPNGTTRAYLSMARKNGKTALIACLVLVHLVGPEAQLNSEIVSGARSRDQAALVYKFASKMVMLNSDLKKIIRLTPSHKMMTGLPMNTEFKSIAAEATTAHGGSPILAILDEVGQVKGPQDDFVDAIETSQGAHDGKALLIAISTQAPTDDDLFSRWIDDAQSSGDPSIVCHIYTAPADCDLNDQRAWKAANPGLDDFRSLRDLEEAARRAERLPANENTFRWLFLNQRIEANSPFISKSLWLACGSDPKPLEGMAVYGSLDLSTTTALTSLTLVGIEDSIINVHASFWLPEEGLRERSRDDRVPYDVWSSSGHLRLTPGTSVEYSYVAHELVRLDRQFNVVKWAFDRWNFKHLKPWLIEAGMDEDEIEAKFVQFGQGYVSMSPALRVVEEEILNRRVAHGNHPVMTWCMSNAVVKMDEAGNRKLNKAKSRGRIDGAVTLVMAIDTALSDLKEGASLDDFLSKPIMVI